MRKFIELSQAPISIEQPRQEIDFEQRKILIETIKLGDRLLIDGKEYSYDRTDNPDFPHHLFLRGTKTGKRVVLSFSDIEDEKRTIAFAEPFIDDVYRGYGENGLWLLAELKRLHPDWNKERLQREFESSPTNTQTRFFREANLTFLVPSLLPHVREHADQQVAPRILEIGASSGEESYSIAVQLREGGVSKFSITAVDISPEELEKARKGEYSFDYHTEMAIPRKYLDKRYFHIKRAGAVTRTGDVLGKEGPEAPILCVADELKKNIHFERGDILKAPVGKGLYDVVVINNVLKHFKEAARNEAVKHALASLRSGGFIVVESIDHRDSPAYVRWRRSFAERFSLEEVPMRYGYGAAADMVGTYFRLKRAWQVEDLKIAA